MIGYALGMVVEKFAAEMKQTNALYTYASSGRLTPEMVTRYLENVRVLIQHTPIMLRRARDGALARGDESLAAHYASKMVEEEGHEVWAEQDLVALRARFEGAASERVSPLLLDLLSFLEEIIDREPALYLSYILLAEYLVVLMGPEWLRLIEERCGIPATMFTVIARHAELDREHAEAGLEAIDALVSDPRLLSPMRDALEQSIAHFQRFSLDVVTRGAPSGSEARRSESWTSSAA